MLSFALCALLAPSVTDDGIPVLRGLDPVALCEGREVPGSDTITATHEGYLYRFADEQSRERFHADRERYAVQMGGACGRMGPLSGKGAVDRFPRPRGSNLPVRVGRVSRRVSPRPRAVFGSGRSGRRGKRSASCCGLRDDRKGHRIPRWGRAAGGMANVPPRTNLGSGEQWTDVRAPLRRDHRVLRRRHPDSPRQRLGRRVSIGPRRHSIRRISPLVEQRRGHLGLGVPRAAPQLVASAVAAAPSTRGSSVPGDLDPHGRRLHNGGGLIRWASRRALRRDQEWTNRVQYVPRSRHRSLLHAHHPRVRRLERGQRHSASAYGARNRRRRRH